MKHLFSKEQVITVPNFLTLIRLLMIPVIIWLYCDRQWYYAAAFMVLLSGLTDILDGIIARLFHQVSDLGKIIDPIADKLTQAAVLWCLHTRYTLIVPLFILFAVKELIMAICGLLVMKKQRKVNSAQWYGKLNTVILYLTMMILLFCPSVGEYGANLLILLCCATMIFALVKYLKFYKTVLDSSRRECAAKKEAI